MNPQYIFLNKYRNHLPSITNLKSPIAVLAYEEGNSYYVFFVNRDFDGNLNEKINVEVELNLDKPISTAAVYSIDGIEEIDVEQADSMVSFSLPQLKALAVVKLY